MICLITNRNICGESKLLLKIREASMAGVDYIYLRENDMSDEAYLALALSCLQMMTGSRTELVVCHRDHIANMLELKKHNRFHERTDQSFTVATHHEDEAKQIKGYYFYSPIFETLCKPGVETKGLSFIESNMIALGGIKLERLEALKGVQHVAIMSEWLESNHVFDLVKAYRNNGY